MMVCLGLGLRAGPRPPRGKRGHLGGGDGACGARGAGARGADRRASNAALDTIRWLGVAYLLWLAAQALRQGPLRPDGPRARPARAFREGMVVNLLNPKVILFVLAFVPQFIDPARAILPQFLVYGLVLALGGFLINGAVGVFAGGLGRRLATSPRLARGLGIVSAAIFTALAARLALMHRS